MLPNLPAPISPTRTGSPAASRCSNRLCKFIARCPLWPLIETRAQAQNKAQCGHGYCRARRQCKLHAALGGIDMTNAMSRLFAAGGAVLCVLVVGGAAYAQSTGE